MSVSDRRGMLDRADKGLSIRRQALSRGRLSQMSRVAMGADPSRCTTGAAGRVWAS
ncbi:hypothetical protein GGD64_008287 [Bradyrhizobium sp. CIR3A]|nr:hypothetical protein [Bradyrhizobium sp. CIR3A]